MSGAIALAALAAGAAAALATPPPRRLRQPPSAPTATPAPDWLRRWRWLWVLLAAVAAAVFVGGVLGLLAAACAAAGTWTITERAEPAHRRRDRERARRDLPHVVGLLGDALRSGQPPDQALALVSEALPGPAAPRLAAVVPRLRLGTDPGRVWSELAADPALGPLGRAFVRAHQSGTPVVPAVERLAEELARTARAEVEDRARRVGVKAAVPLGVCLLPAFILLGIVPIVAGLLTNLGI